MQHFTERFKNRFVEMGCSEPDLQVRKAALAILECIDKHGLLETDHRQQIAACIFHVDPKVRAAVASFFASLIEEDIGTRVDEGASASTANSNRARLWFKSFAALLIQSGKPLGGSDEDAGQQDGIDATLDVEIAKGPAKGRAALAVAALWNEEEAVQRWDVLAEYLLLDHSAEAADEDLPDVNAAVSNAKGKVRASVDQLGEGQKLEAEEEEMLIEVLVAVLAHHKADEDAAGGKKVYSFSARAVYASASDLIYIGRRRRRYGCVGRHHPSNDERSAASILETPSGSFQSISPHGDSNNHGFEPVPRHAHGDRESMSLTIWCFADHVSLSGL